MPGGFEIEMELTDAGKRWIEEIMSDVPERDQPYDEDLAREVDGDKLFHSHEVMAGRRPAISFEEWQWMDRSPRPTREGREGDTQGMPVESDSPVMHDLVIEDLQARLAVGIKRYGRGLQAFNGRDALQDIYEELLDAAVYIRQAIWERSHPRG